MNQDEINEFMYFVCNQCCSCIDCDQNEEQYWSCFEEYKKVILEE